MVEFLAHRIEGERRFPRKNGNPSGSGAFGKMLPCTLFRINKFSVLPAVLIQVNLEVLFPRVTRASTLFRTGVPVAQTPRCESKSEFNRQHVPSPDHTTQKFINFNSRMHRQMHPDCCQELGIQGFFFFNSILL